jgi:hypothetical protein
MALLSAMATLFAALFLCLGPHESHRQDGAATAVAAPWDAAGTEAGIEAGAESEAEYSCPYDKGDCGLFSHLSPAVLTVPPPADPLAAEVQLPHPGLPCTAGRMPRPAAAARAPDLHVLQVLRT